jgi:hypothetical protein
MPTHKCLAGCGKHITWQFALCSECEKTYGTSSYSWPAWLRWLWKDILKERRQYKNRLRFEVSISDIEYVVYPLTLTSTDSTDNGDDE